MFSNPQSLRNLETRKQVDQNKIKLVQINERETIFFLIYFNNLQTGRKNENKKLMKSF